MKVKNKNSESVTIEFSIDEYEAFVELLKFRTTPSNNTKLSQNDDLIRYILNANNLLIILKVLENRELTTEEISEITKIDIILVLVGLLELKRKGLVTYNEENETNLYYLTNLGKEVLSMINQHKQIL